jgi:hypothetical protein
MVARMERSDLWDALGVAENCGIVAQTLQDGLRLGDDMSRWLRGELALGFILASLFWIAILGWIESYAPTEAQKQECYEAAKRTGHKNEECKSLWEKTTSDPVALFTLVLAFSTVGLWVATIGLYRAGDRRMALIERNAERHSGHMQASVAEATRAASAMERVAESVARSATAAAESVETLQCRCGHIFRLSLGEIFVNLKNDEYGSTSDQLSPITV